MGVKNVVFDAYGEAVRLETIVGLTRNVGGRGQDLILIRSAEEKVVGESVVGIYTWSKGKVATTPDLLWERHKDSTDK
jgi:hypothetical protein